MFVNLKCLVNNPDGSKLLIYYGRFEFKNVGPDYMSGQMGQL